MDELSSQFVELMTASENAAQAQQFNPIYEKDVFGKKVLTFEGIDRDKLAGLGELRTPNVADLFVAKVKGGVK